MLCKEFMQIAMLNLKIFLPVATGKVRLGCKIFAVAKIFINSVLEMFETIKDLI